MKNRRIYAAALIMVLLIGLAAAGCGEESSQADCYYYHIDDTGLALEKDTLDLTAYLRTQETSEDAAGTASGDASGDGSADAGSDASGDPDGSGQESQTQLIAQAMADALNDADSDSLFPEGVRITEVSISGIVLTLDFTAEYSRMEELRELLCRAAVVETMLQVDEITGVMFTVEGEALLDEDGAEIGLMTANTFITNPASQINATQEATVVLYFTDSDGTILYPEERTLHYFTSMSEERMVVEQLISGPDADESALSATLPAETSVISVTTADGICYVNLDEAFLSTSFTVQPQTVIYSLVNSLCELDGVDGVQILIDGSSELVYQDAVELNQVFSMDESMIAAEADPVITEVPEEE